MNDAVLLIGFFGILLSVIIMVVFEEEGCTPTFVIIIIAAFLILVNYDKRPNTPEQEAAQAIVDKKCPNKFVIVKGIPKCTDDLPPPPKEEKTVKEEPPPPPKEEPKDPDEFDFQKWSENAATAVSVVCDSDGNSVNVSAYVYTKGDSKGTPQSYAVWTRLDANGKPIRCNNGKSPKADEPQKDVRY